MKKLLVILLLLVTIGCAKKYTKPAGEGAGQPEATKKEEAMKTEKTAGMKEEVVKEVIVFEDSKVTESSATAPEEKQAPSDLRDIFFEYDKYDIIPDARPVLNDAASFLDKNKVINVVIEGHCDERGTNEYNLALGERRAKSVKNYLVSLGISPNRISVITYGEEKPVCTEQGEDCWHQNRRAHFVIVK